ncbi:MAG: iron dicitrate transport regulator FecR [Synechococcaceae cyanobacterium]|nr:iron dicitrate transport regulator FecR [Synechococcaceae cyanobacterium]
MHRPDPLPRTAQRRLVGLAAGLLLLGAGAAPAVETAVVQEILDGKELFIDQQRARPLDRAKAPQQLRTGASRGQIGFESGAAGRLNRFSLLRLGHGCFLLERGQILVSGRQAGCTRSSRMSVRGTNYVLGVNDDGSSELSVLEGRVEVEPLRDGEPSGQAATIVMAGQRLRLSVKGAVLALLGLSEADYNSVLQGPLFEGFRLPLPAYGSLESYLRSRLPGVSLPSLPSAPIPLPSAPSVPSVPSFSLPRFF